MKTTKLIIFLILTNLFCVLLSAKQVSVLTIGNSFADSVFKYLPQVVKSVPDCQLVLERANHGGCELDRHWSYIEKEENESAKMYRNNSQTLKQILQSKKWDIVTIQQASHKSWKPETFMPYAKNIFDYIKKNSPKSEVVIQQTWSYRSDDSRIMKGGEWGIDQTEMFKRLESAYANLAKELNLRIIPTGLAVQNARQMQPIKFKNYDKQILKTIQPPDLPPQAGSIVGNFKWNKGKDGELYLYRDSIHLSDRGQYLQACLWFAFLFDKPATDIKFVPSSIGNKDAEFLRKVAQDTIESFNQPR